MRCGGFRAESVDFRAKALSKPILGVMIQWWDASLQGSVS